MKKAFLSVLTIVMLGLGATIILPVQAPTPPVSAQQSDKYDGDCTGHETAGRCADKCPEGSYLIGYKDDTSAAICKLEPTGCPYGDSIPMDMCDKFAPQEEPVQELPVMEGK